MLNTKGIFFYKRSLNHDDKQFFKEKIKKISLLNNINNLHLESRRYDPTKVIIAQKIPSLKH